ncbi:23S rRNA (guanosine(2251)-2'-O)-methyltransferase RlmB [Caloranaerobacter azorensis]|uniref:23S rRNA (Guanosine(2251)-2'-O)-methyltransferase RlmB n=1 Tax=Caloranaerobacter azorensis TaxID=116090 RepID=A0A6P1YD30_9FIRM|nr:23S rRNA (guanosine(2251)-2'-O)-methyltransferase RlmB [Caloranaerobacter azorensis]QIB27210.1 23S rRNA (guanosine(2251)-2'-O)-methyltransferase RlmB [Caloranaerobacter azorensis]
MEVNITSLSNPLIKSIKSLHKKRDRWKQKKFFVEGVRAVEEAIKSDAKIDLILYTESLFDTFGGQELFKLIDKREYRLLKITEKILKTISDTENPQGIIAVIEFNLVNLEDIFIEQGNFIIILDRIQDPGNLGTIIRTADAFGSNGIVLTSGCVDVFNPKTIRATMGSLFHLPISYEDNIKDVITKFKESGIKIIATSLDAKHFCYDVDLLQDFALIIGNEASGVSKEAIELSDYKIKIPIEKRTESLNAAIASGVIMYETYRQRKTFKS